MPVAFWESAEEPIIQHMEGDALSILDCCMASTAGIKCRDPSLRAYQLLAASLANGATLGPGENSFTKALCDSLEELLPSANGGTFPLTQLCERINTKRQSEACLSWDRLRSFNRIIQLGRLEQSEDAVRLGTPEQSSLLLRLSFKTRDLQNEQIERLAEQFPQVCQDAKVQLLRIDWVRMMTAEREVGQNLGILQNVPRPGDIQRDDLLAIGDNEALMDMYQVSRRLTAARSFREAFNRRRAERAQTTRNPAPKCISWSFIAAMILKVLSLLLMFSLLYFRGEQTALVLSGIMMAWMVMYGPCRMRAFRDSRQWASNQDPGLDGRKCLEVCVAT